MEGRKRPQDGISQEQRLVVAEKYFGGRFQWFGNIWEFIVQELGLEESQGAHKPWGRAPTACGRPSLVGFFWSKKSHRKVLFRLDSV